MLNAYLASTRLLLQNPAAPVALYSDANLTSFINTARGQLAGESRCIRRRVSLSLSPGTQEYSFALFTPLPAGVDGVIHVRTIQYVVGTGFLPVAGRAWEWFERFSLGTAVPNPGPPVNWAQYGQGAASGSFFIDPAPDVPYTVTCDCTCYPNLLAADGDAEAIPYLWTDAVSYFAAYLALMSAQTSTRTAEAQKMYQLYQLFVNRARRAANPDVDTFLYEQAEDPAQLNSYSQQGAQAQ